MMELSDFLLQRIAEDEAVAQAAWEDSWRVYCWWVDGGEEGTPEEFAEHLASSSHADEASVVDSDLKTVVYDEGAPAPEEARHIARHDPARVLAECDSKRRIVAWASDLEYGGQEDDLLKLLALPYAGHPDYDESWRP